MIKITKTGIIAAVVALTVMMLLNTDESPEEYIKSIEHQRRETAKFMNNSDNSPFAAYPDSLVQLNYYPPNPDFRVRAKIELIEGSNKVTLANSDGTSTAYKKYAYAKFKIDDREQKLLVLQSIGRVKHLSTMFTDLTSGEETYGGGRYLDLDFKNAKTITIDFNLAYNPYCMYNADFSCPLPPGENKLSVKIEAGEKVYGQK